MTSEGQQVGRRMAKGAAWMVGVRLLDRSVGLISTFVLARILLPADFGLVTLAMTVIAIIEVWSEFSFDLALIRDQTAERDQYDTAWTLTLIRSLIVASALGLGAGQISHFFDEPRLANVLYVLALASLLEGAHSIRIVDFRKELNLHKEFSFLMTARLVQFVVTITLAFLWQDYWALVCGILVNRLVRLVLSYIMAPYRPRLTLCAIGELFRFSSWIVVNSVLNFVITRLDTIILGRLTGVSAVGLYSMGYEISNMATTELVWPISRAIFPGFAKFADRKAELMRSYNLSLSVIVLVALPATTGIAMTADYFVPILLGEKWLAVIPLIQVLSVYGGLRVLIANTGALYLAVNRPYLISIMAGVNLAVLAPMMVWLVQSYGAIGAAWAVVAGCVPMVLIMFWFNSVYIGIKFTATLPYLIRPILACAGMVGVLMLVRSALPVSADLTVGIGRLVLLVAVGAAVYILVILATWRLMKHDDGIEPIIFNLVRDRIRPPRPQ